MLKKSIKTDVVLSVPKKQSTIYHRIFIIALLLISILMAHGTSFFHEDRFSAILMVSLLIIALLYQFLCHDGVQKQDRYLWLFLLIDILPNIIYQGHDFLKALNFLFVNILLAYWFLGCGHHRIQDQPSNFILIDLLHATIHAPFHYLKSMCSFAQASSTSIANRKNLIKIGVGCVLSLPLLLIILPLLSSADATFSSYLSNIQINQAFINELCRTLLCTIPIFLYYLSMSYGNMKNKDTPLYDKEKEYHRREQLAMIPTMIYTALETVLVITYFLFLIASFQSILSSLSLSKELFSFSDFARRGFFELCMIATINLSVIGFVRLTGNGKSKSFVRMEKLLIIETLLLIISAMTKMILYIYAYQALTYLRIYACWFIIVLFGLFLILFFQTESSKHTLLKMTYYVMICFLILNISNVSYWAKDSVMDVPYETYEEYRQ